MKNMYDEYPLTLTGQSLFRARRIIAVLYGIPRTGWVDQGVKNPETVGEHTDELVSMAEELFDIPGLSMMLKIHDWPESEVEVGDRRTDNFCPADRRISKKDKYELELRAMERICSSFGPEGEVLLGLWQEFEEQITDRAIIARQLDKFQAIMKAIDYQKAGEPVDPQEFISHDGSLITHPVLRQLLSVAQSGL